VTWTRPISAWEGSGAVTASASGLRRRLLLRVVLDFQRKKETGEIGEAEMCNRPHRPTIIGKIDRGNRRSATTPRASLTMSGKKETVLDLGKFIDKGVRVKLAGGREGTL